MRSSQYRRITTTPKTPKSSLSNINVLLNMPFIFQVFYLLIWTVTLVIVVQ